MLSFLLNDANFWFSCALGIVIALFVLELAGMLFGISLLGLADDDPGFETDAEVSSGFTEFASWLALDRLPLMVWLVLLFTCFGVLGLLTNFIAQSVLSVYVPNWLSMVIAGVLGLLATARFGAFIALILPKQETSATSYEELVGTVGTITVGVARPNSPAEGKFIDTHGQPHYVLVEPMDATEQFSQGEQIVLVQKQQHKWLATRYLDI